MCGAHFVDDDYFPSALDEGSKTKRRRKDSIPSVFSFNPSKPSRPSREDRRSVAAARAADLEVQKRGEESETERRLREELKQATDRIQCLEAENDRLKEEVTHLRRQLFRFENIKNDDAQLAFLTELNRETWDALWKVLQVSEHGIQSQAAAAREKEVGRKISTGSGRKPALSLEDQLLVALMRLRLGNLEEQLAYLFGINVSNISRLLSMWYNFLYLRLGLIPIWPTWDNVASTMPAAFRKAYPDTFIILDATELRCERPSAPDLQAKLYSPYKSHTTFKCLVGIAPNGAFTFISQLFAGCICDRQVVIDSGILDMLKEVPQGKRVMADRGFDVQDLLVETGLVLNIPPFKGSSKTMPRSDVVKTQKIASVRIHVERAIGRVKSRFTFFQKDIPLAVMGSVNQMWTVSFLLCNFLGPLIDEQL